MNTVHRTTARAALTALLHSNYQQHLPYIFSDNNCSLPFNSFLSEILVREFSSIPKLCHSQHQVETTTDVASTPKAGPVIAFCLPETLPDFLVDRISWFLTAFEVAQTANSSHVCRKFLKPALSYCWEVFVDSEKHTVSNIYR